MDNDRRKPLNPLSEWLEPDPAPAGDVTRFRIKGTKILLGPFYRAGSKQAGPRTYFKF